MPAVAEKKKDALKITSLAELEAAIADAAGPVEEEAVKASLAQYLRSEWQSVRDARATTIDKIMLRNTRQVNGQYDPEKLVQIAKMPGGSKLYPMITADVAQTAALEIKSIIGQNDPSWGLDVEPGIELPPDVTSAIFHAVLDRTIKEIVAPMAATGQVVDPATLSLELGSRMSKVSEDAYALQVEEAKRRADGMSKKIQTQWEEGGGPAALEECITDYTRQVYSALKGPVVRNEKVIEYEKSKKGRFVPKMNIVPTPVFERRPPEAIYPCVGTTDIEHGDVFDFYRLSRGDINKFIGLPGYNEVAVRAVLSEYASGGLAEWVSETLTSDMAATTKEVDPTNQGRDPLIDALNFWGSVPGSMLLEWGMDEKRITDPELEYEVEAWLIGNYVIRCVINPDPLGRHPYSTAHFGMEPGQLHGTSLCEKIRAAQMLCCDEFLNIQRNSFIASGPIPEVDGDRVPNASRWVPEPWAPIVSTGDQMSKGNAVKFNDVPMKADQLMSVYEKFRMEAYQLAGVSNPAQPEASPTVGGQSMSQTAKKLGMESHAINIEDHIIAPAIKRMFDFNMQFDEDESIKGDAKVRILGIHSLVAKELKLKRRLERLAAMNNPTDLAITGIEGRRADWEDALKEEGSDPSRILKGDMKGPQGAAAPSQKPAETDSAGNLVAGRDFRADNG